MNSLLMHCRPGFEGEVCAEIGGLAARHDIAGYAKATPASAFAEFLCATPGDTERLMGQVDFAKMVFVRQWARGSFVDVPDGDRIQPLLRAVEAYPTCASLWLEVLDSNQGKALSTFCRKFEKPLRSALKRSGKLQDGLPGAPRLLLTFLSGRRLFLGVAATDNSAAWPGGVPRLKFPRQAPSRSTLKLEEAWHHFIPAGQWPERLAPGMRAADLGAAPGGWTWQLVNRGMRVTAVDNGPMNPELMESGLVEHLRADGFRYRPPRALDWMVCDIVEKPARNAALLEQWIGEGWCQETVVNLKLPMKQRHAEVQRLLQRITEGLDKRGVRAQVACRQLYHDREEVSCHVRRL